MENQTINELMQRKSVRVYEDRPISEQDKRTILECATQAPSAGNMQMYSIIDVTDADLKQKLAKSCDNQSFIADAPMVLVFVADYQKWYDAFSIFGKPRKVGVGDITLAITDTTIAAQNAVVAAWALGVGSCYIGDILENCEAIREMLDLPSYCLPCAMLVMGYPTKQQLERKKSERVPLEDIVMNNSYQRKDSEQLQKMFENKTGPLDFKTWSTTFCERKYNSDFSKEMTRSVKTYLDGFAKHEEY